MRRPGPHLMVHAIPFHPRNAVAISKDPAFSCGCRGPRASPHCASDHAVVMPDRHESKGAMPYCPLVAQDATELCISQAPHNLNANIKNLAVSSSAFDC